MDASKHKTDENIDLIAKRRRIQKSETRRTMAKWIGIIFLAAILVIVFIKVVPPLFKNLDIIDNTYRPRDVERQYHQIQKLRDPKGREYQGGGDATKGGGS